MKTVHTTAPRLRFTRWLYGRLARRLARKGGFLVIVSEYHTEHKVLSVTFKINREEAYARIFP